MNGRLYGIGTGPGDSELMTLKAVRVLKECDVIALPISNVDCVSEPILEEAGKEKNDIIVGSCVAYGIIKPNIENIDDKAFLYLPMPMIKDKEKLEAIHDAGAAAVAKLLKEGKKVGFPTLGDPSVYSTYMYIHKRILEYGLEAEMIAGIPSFCAAAARLNISLSENSDQLHILPASYEGLDEHVKLAGTKILMKSGRKMKNVKDAIKKAGQKFLMVENCGMENENIYTRVEDVPDESSYYSLIIVKEK